MVTNISSRRLDDDATSTTHLTARLAVLDHHLTGADLGFYKGGCPINLKGAPPPPPKLF